MLDPLFLQHLTHGRVTGELMNQLVRLYPEIPIEASLPLLAARLMGAAPVDDDEEPDEDYELASA
jgi:hypothetical protein